MNPFYQLRLILIAIIQIVLLNSGYSQFTNDWIKPEQKYLKIGVKSKGIYEISYQKLREKGLNVSDNNISTIALFHRGKEVAIVTTDNGIIFYGEPNDGSSDSLLYRPYSTRVNEHYSMFSDIGYYFLTLGNSNGLRMNNLNNKDSQSVETHQWHWADILNVYNSQHSYSFGINETPSLLQSYYTNGETRTGNIVLGTVKSNYTLKLENIFQSHNSPISSTLEVMANNRSSVSNIINVTSNNIFLHTFNIAGFNGNKNTFSLPQEIIKNGSIDLSIFSNLSTSKFSVTYLHLKYPQFITNLNIVQQKVLLPTTHYSKSKFSISQSPNNNPLVAYDVTDKYDVKEILPITQQDSLTFYTDRTPDKESTIYLTSSYLTESTLELVNFHSFNPTDTDLIIITNRNLKLATQDYANYRNSSKGGSYKATVFDIQDIYNNFNYGEPSPVAIKNFCKFMLSDKNYKKYLLLIGHSITYPNRIIKELKGVPDNNQDFMDIDQIPSVGYPGSDVLLVDGLDESNTINLPSIPVGRLAATLPEQVYNYLDKVIEFEIDTIKTYQKTVLHLSGGKSTSEITTLKNHLSDLEGSVTNSFHGGFIEALAKQTLNPVDQVDISQQVNEGVGLITYFGHGSGTTTDYNMGYASYVNRGYQNKGKYPFMYFNGCGVANIFPGRYSIIPNTTFEVALSTDWVLAKEKGAIAVLANSGDSYISTSSNYLNTLYKYLFNNQKGLSIGQIQREVTKELLAKNISNYDIANIHQSFLQGDPSIKIFYQTKSDYTFKKNSGIIISSSNKLTTIGDANELKVRFNMANIGANVDETGLTLSVSITYNNSIKTFTYLINEIKNETYFEITLPNTEPIQSVRAHIESLDKYLELDENNNERILIVDWGIAEKISEYSEIHFKDVVIPSLNVSLNGEKIQNHQKVLIGSPLRIQLIDDSPLTNYDKALINIYYRECLTCSFKELQDNLNFNFNSPTSPKVLTAVAKLNSLSIGTYELLFRGRDISGNESNYFSINIEVIDKTNIPSVDIVASPNPGFGYFKIQATFNDPTTIDKVEYLITDILGSNVSSYVDSKIIDNISKWSWSHPMPGIYLYRVKIFTKEGEIVKSGKIVNYP